MTIMPSLILHRKIDEQRAEKNPAVPMPVFRSPAFEEPAAWGVLFSGQRRGPDNVPLQFATNLVVRVV
jgi:hypothetical protein